VTCLSALLTAYVVIAASLLGGCSDHLPTAGGGPAPAPAPIRSATRSGSLAALPPPAARQSPPRQGATSPAPGTAPSATAAAPVVLATTAQRDPPTVRAAPAPKVAAKTPSPPAGRRLRERLASIALDDQDLSQIRGGFEASSGVTLNFAFQQATFINNNLVQTVVVPSLTISPGQGGVSVAGASPTGATPPSVNVGSLTGLGVSAQTRDAVSSAKLLTGGTVQAQVSPASPMIQALVNSGMTSLVTSLGNGGLTSVIGNAANNRVVQQMTTIDLGVTGLSGLVQQSVPTSILNRISGPNSFR
jgi:hypothetical protein